MKKFIIEENQLQAILGYLGSCPFNQVAQLVTILSSLPEYKEKTEEGVIEQIKK